MSRVLIQSLPGLYGITFNQNTGEAKVATLRPILAWTNSSYGEDVLGPLTFNGEFQADAYLHADGHVYSHVGVSLGALADYVNNEGAVLWNGYQNVSFTPPPVAEPESGSVIQLVQP